MRLPNILRRLSVVAAGPLILYLLAALFGSHIPRNPAWSEAPYGTTVYVATNDYHTGIIVPAVSEEMDWRGRIQADHLSDPAQSGNWLLFGWGDREFYLNTPTWRHLTVRTALTAIVGSGASLVHVDHLDEPSDAVDIRAVTLSKAEYRRLTDFIAASFAPGGGDAIPGYGASDVFYPGTGRYSLFYTCNSWTADALAAAGVKVALWTPFEGGVMRWF